MAHDSNHSPGPVDRPPCNRDAVLIALATAVTTINRSRPYFLMNSQTRLTGSTYARPDVVGVLPKEDHDARLVSVRTSPSDDASGSARP
jgi:hypothetical protein